MTELEEQIVAEARKNLPFEIKFAVDDPTRFQLSFHDDVIVIKAIPGFLYERVNHLWPVFIEAAESCGIYVETVHVVKMYPDGRSPDDEAPAVPKSHPPRPPLDFTKLNALFKDPVPEPKPEKKFIDYFEWMKSPAWRQIRNRKMKESGYKCELCGSAKNLHVHHITYENIGHEPLDDLLVVCNKCHKKLHEEDFKKKGGH